MPHPCGEATWKWPTSRAGFSRLLPGAMTRTWLKKPPGKAAAGKIACPTLTGESRVHTDEIGSVIGAPAPFPARDVRIGTKGPRSGHAAGGIRSALVTGGDD